MDTPTNPTAAAPVEPVTAPAAAAVTPPAKPGLAAVVSAVLTSARAKFNATADLAAANQKISALTTELATAKSESASLAARHASLETQLATVAGFFGLDPAALVGKDAAACAEVLRTKIDAAALDAIAGMGLDTAALPKTSSVTPATSARLTHSEFMALDHAGRMKFSVSGGRITEPGNN